MIRVCPRCEKPFEVTAIVDERMRQRGFHQRLCPPCALAAIYDACAESVIEMIDEEIKAELRASGVDLDAFKEEIAQMIVAAREGGEVVSLFSSESFS